MMLYTNQDLIQMYGAVKASYDLTTGMTTLRTPNAMEYVLQPDGMWIETHEMEQFRKFASDLFDYLRACNRIPLATPCDADSTIDGRVAPWQRLLTVT